MAKTYRVGVIGRTGHGDYGHELDTAWLSIPNVEVVAVADDNKDGLAKTASKLKVKQAFTDYREMLDKAKPDIAAVATRWVDQHRDMVLAAAERGVHVYMEKPLCRTLAEADEIVAAGERTHTKLAVAYPTRYSPRLETVKQLIASGKIGKVLEYRGRGKEDSQRGGGEDLWVLGSHIMDMIRVLGGHPLWCFARVTQNGKPITKKDVADGAEGIGPLAGDSVQAQYGMKDGSAAYFASVRKSAGKPPRYALQILGTNGIIEVLEGPLAPVKFLGDPSWSPGRSGKKWEDVTSAGIGKPEPLGKEYEARHYVAILDLLKAIEQDRQPLSSAYEARGVTEMVAAVFESQRSGGMVELPLKNRQNPLTML